MVGCWKRLVIRSTPAVMIDRMSPSTLASAQAASMQSDSTTFDPNLELQIEKSEGRNASLQMHCPARKECAQSEGHKESKLGYDICMMSAKGSGITGEKRVSCGLLIRARMPSSLGEWSALPRHRYDANLGNWHHLAVRFNWFTPSP